MGSIARLLLVVSFLLWVVGCASAGVRTEGATGPVAWQATDFKLAETTVNNQPGERYSFVLLLKETHGIGITFTELQQTVFQHGVLQSAARQQTGRWRLRPKGELRVPLAFSWYCPILPCDQVHGAPWWHITITGTDDRGQPVKLTLDVAPPPVP